MKFAIITHAEHKLSNNHIYAYEPYVREMNLWIKYVDEVQIVAPVSKEKVTSIEGKYQVQHGAKCHSEQSEAISSKEQIAASHTPRNDGKERHSEQREAILLKEQIAASHTPRNDEFERHIEQREAILSKEQIATSHTPRNDELIKLTNIPAFDITSFKNGLIAIYKIPKICVQIYKAMKWADHIHLRCPGNIGLLGSIVQILFPNKPKTIKYAGNWDPKSIQPLSYRLQKWILSNTFLTKNAKVLVYGEWPNQTKNIVPFFTASYSEKEITERHSEQSEAISSKEQIATSHTPRNDGNNSHSQQITERSRSVDWESHLNTLNFIFVGGLTSGKQPLLSVKVIRQLKERGYAVQLDIYGDGSERNKVEKYIEEYQLQNTIQFHGNVSKKIIKEAYQKADFLLFISKSEGWPKVVAEAMFWGCLPISSGVSCIPYMLDNGVRGAIVNSDINEIVSVVENYLANEEKYNVQVKKAMNWSRQYTLERFEKEIYKIITN